MRFFLSILCIIFLTCSIFPQKTLTLDEAITTALHRNTTLEKAENNIKTFEAGKMAAIGNLLPGVGGSAGYEWNRTTGITQTYVNGVPLSTTGSTESRQYSVGVGYNWVLFDGLSNLANLSRSDNNLQSAKLSLMRMKQDVVFQTISLYYDVVNARQLLKVKQDDLKRFQKNLETTTERNKLGAVTLADVYAQQVQVGNAELEVIRTQNILETGKTNLLYYLGLDVLEKYSYTDTLTNQEQELLKNKISEDYTNLTELVNLALQTRPDYKSKKFDVESAENGVTAAWGGYMPTLSNNGNFGTSADNVKDLFTSRRYSLGLSLNIPIFSNFATDNQVQQARVFSENTTVELTELERDIKRNIQTTFLNLQAAEKALEVGERNVVAAGENQKIEEEKYSLGSGTLLNVLVANADLTNAVTNYINAQFAYIVLSQQLKYHLGNLDYNKYEQ